MISRKIIIDPGLGKSIGRNVTEACFESGFQNYNNFITTFRKSTGYTPKQYKDMLKLK
jgi:AraC-like DNA-binding protein